MWRRHLTSVTQLFFLSFLFFFLFFCVCVFSETCHYTKEGKEYEGKLWKAGRGNVKEMAGKWRQPLAGGHVEGGHVALTRLCATWTHDLSWGGNNNRNPIFGTLGRGVRGKWERLGGTSGAFSKGTWGANERVPWWVDAATEVFVALG